MHEEVGGAGGHALERPAAGGDPAAGVGERGVDGAREGLRRVVGAIFDEHLIADEAAGGAEVGTRATGRREVAVAPCQQRR